MHKRNCRNVVYATGSCFSCLQKQPPRLFSKISVLFFQEHLFLYFSRRLYVFTEQMPIFQEGLSVRRTDTNFPGKRGLFSEQIPFSRSIFLATEQITIFQEAFFEYQRTDKQFPGRYLPPNRYFSIRSQWLLLLHTLEVLVFKHPFIT